MRTLYFNRFLGKLISQYISVYIHEGVKHVEIIFDGFDYERWKKSYLKSHNEEVLLYCYTTYIFFLFIIALG